MKNKKFLIRLVIFGLIILFIQEILPRILDGTLRLM